MLLTSISRNSSIELDAHFLNFKISLSKINSPHHVKDIGPEAWWHLMKFYHCMHTSILFTLLLLFNYDSLFKHYNHCIKMKSRKKSSRFRSNSKHWMGRFWIPILDEVSNNWFTLILIIVLYWKFWRRNFKSII